MSATSDALAILAQNAVQTNAKLDALISALAASATVPQIPTVQTATTAPQTTATPPANAPKATAPKTGRKARRGKAKAGRTANPLLAGMTADQAKAAKADRTVTGSLEGTVSRIAEHGRGLHLIETGEQWHNVVDGGNPIFLSLAVGQTVRFDTNAVGRIVMAYVNATKSSGSTRLTTGKATEGASAPATPQDAPATTTPPTTSPATATAPQNRAARRAAAAAEVAATVAAGEAAATARLSKAGAEILPCPFCKGADHKNYSRDQIRDECAMRQYIAATGNSRPDVVAPDTYVAWAVWMSERDVTVFTHAAPGFMVIEGSHKSKAPVVTPPAAPKTARRTASGPTAPKAPVTVETTPATKASIWEVGKTYTGLIARDGKAGSNIVKITVASVAPTGANLAVTSEIKTAKLAKLKMNDKVGFTIGLIPSTELGGTMVPGIVKMRKLDSIEKVTGEFEGVKTSGRNAPPAPKAPVKDEVVSKARQQRAALRGQKFGPKAPATTTTTAPAMAPKRAPATGGFACECGRTFGTIALLTDHVYDCKPAAKAS